MEGFETLKLLVVVQRTPRVRHLFLREKIIVLIAHKLASGGKQSHDSSFDS